MRLLLVLLCIFVVVVISKRYSKPKPKPKTSMAGHILNRVPKNKKPKAKANEPKYPTSEDGHVFVETEEIAHRCKHIGDCNEIDGLETYPPAVWWCYYYERMGGCDCDEGLEYCVVKRTNDGQKQYGFCHPGKPRVNSRNECIDV